MAALVGAPQASAQQLQVLDISANATTEELGKAREAFTKGSAIVRLLGASSTSSERLFGISPKDVNIYSQRSADPNALKSAPHQNLKLQAMAAYTDASGVVRTVLSFAPDATQATGAAPWKQHLDEWIQQQQANLGSAALLGDPAPPPQAWTLLYTVTLQHNEGAGGYGQSTNSYYRLNTTSNLTDYYMVTTVPQTTPAWHGNCDGLVSCDWHTIERDISIDGSKQGATLVDHGPTGTINSSTAGFTIGGGVGPTGPNGSAGFSATWTQPDVTTTDNSTGQSASWTETMNFPRENRCLPVVGDVPGTSSGTFLSRQAAIFSVPGGTTSLSFPMTFTANFCEFDLAGFRGSIYDSFTITGDVQLAPPVLTVFPTNLTIPAGGSASLLVNAFIPHSDQGVAWQITSNKPWLSVPSGGPFSAGQVIPISVVSGAPADTGTLSVNTYPPFAAASVAGSPLLVNVSVGPSKSAPVAGVLLFGGTLVPPEIGIAQAEFYDLTTRQAFPLKPNANRARHTATHLPSGKILIVGGEVTLPQNLGQPGQLTATAELYDPASFSFSYTGSLATARYNHTATLLPDGKVLIVGGFDSNNAPLDSAELYDPASGQFSSAGKLQKGGRESHYASLITAPGKPHPR
jgi:hypothetical protein